ncbi:MAG: tetratricopeptide repeat protein [Bacteroidia bacterium]|nr:tetratricopeptide repeat protein [Bacteroidia bacterium]NNM22943.1 tetratricopeptide repeat protein [Flavobacteriaceae bacterium]
MPVQVHHFPPRIYLYSFLLSLLLIGCANPRSPETLDTNPELDSLSGRLEMIVKSSLADSEKRNEINAILDQAQKFPIDTLRRNLFLDLGDAFEKIGDLETFRELNSNTYSLSAKMKDSMGMALSRYMLGRHYFSEDKIDSAYRAHYQSEQLFASIGEFDYAGKARLSMAIIQKNEKDYIGGEDSSIKAMDYFSRTGNLRWLASSNTNLGLISDLVGHHDRAIEYHLKALEQRKALKNKEELIASSYNNLGLAHANKKEYSRAIEYYQQGLAYDSLFQKRSKTYTRLMDNLAYARFLSGERDGLEKALLRPLRLRDSLNDNLGAVMSYIHLAEYHKEMDSIQLARSYAQTALEKAIPIDYHRGILESLMLLADTSEEDKALDYTRRYIELSDSLTARERAFQEQFTRVRYETDEIAEEKEQVTRTNRQLIILSLALAVFSLIVYILIRQKATRKELEFVESQHKTNEEIYQLMLSQRAKFEEGKHLEKVRISEELHDGVLGRLFGVRLSLDSYNNKIDEKSVDTRAKYIDELKNIEGDIRKISHDLNAEMLQPDMLFVDVVENLIHSVSTINEEKVFETEFFNDFDVNWEKVPNTVKVHLYRIIQESLQNIRKHASAKTVGISFKKEQDRISLQIKDDGVGMNVLKTKKGIGLKNIRSRVKKIDGEFELLSTPGEGTTITVSYPEL